MDTVKVIATAEDAHVKGWVHNMMECSLCTAAREKTIAQLEADGKFEVLWKYYRRA